MNKKLLSIRTMVAVGIGAAIFFVLMRFVAIPSGIPNINLNLAAAILSLFAGIFGPVAGLLIAFIGHTIVDLTWGFGVWWSWVIADAVFGLILGLFWKKYRIEEGAFGVKEAVLFNVMQVSGNAIGSTSASRGCSRKTPSTTTSSACAATTRCTGTRTPSTAASGR